jgi:general stress protein 26
MPELTLKQIADRMAGIDFGMLSTRAAGGALASRPMSNNGEVEYRGDSYFFSYEDTRKVADITRDARVGLTFTGTKGLLGRPPLFIAIEGEAELIRDKAAFAERWTSGLEHWFEQGIDTPGLILIKVAARRVHYWDGDDEGEIVV